MAQEGLRIVAVLGERDYPNAGTHVHRMPVDDKWLLEGGQDLLRDHLGGGEARRGQQHDKLVATQAGEDVRCTENAPEPWGDLAEQHVARRVTAAVVDLFESVEIEQQHGYGTLVATCRT